MPERVEVPVPQTTHAGRLVRRRRWAVAAAVTAMAVSGAGVVGAGFVQSPTQAAADARAPLPSVITAPVVREVMRSTVILRGTFSDGRTVSVTPASVAPTAGSAGGGALVVTGVFTAPGQPVTAGKALVEYSGRPVFALPGKLPMYRDLAPGASGKDVEQLQTALASLGYATTPDGKGVFEAGTRGAVARLYDAMGYPAPTGGGVPAAEAVFLAALPARTVSVPVSVGDTVKGPVLSLALGGPQLAGRLDPGRGALIKAGMKVDVLSETTGATASGTVDSVGALTSAANSAANPSAGGDPATAGGTGSQPGPGAAAGGAAYLPLTVRPDQPWDTQFAGQDVRITVTAAATADAVLAVPEAAVSSGADARTTVAVQSATGGIRTVVVQTGVSADGMVQVTPQGGTLAADDRVVVGQ